MPKPTPSSLKDGDLGTYDSANAAAIAGLRSITEEQAELGGGVLFNPKTGKYAYTQPVGQGKGAHFSAAISVPAGWQLKALYHTHPKGDNSTWFSQDDISMAHQLKLPSYILPRADNKIRMFEPGKTPVTRGSGSQSDPHEYSTGSDVDETVHVAGSRDTGDTPPPAAPAPGADPWGVLSVGGNVQPPDATPPAPGGGWEVAGVGGDEWAPVAVNGEALQPHQGFWKDFGQGSGGFLGLLKAPFTESIPVEAVKATYRDVQAHPEHLDNPLGAVFDRVEAFLSEPESKDLPARIRKSFGDTVALAKQRPGLVTGSLVRGLAADPELLVVPGLGEEAAAARATAALGGGRAARIAGTIAGKATAATAGAALGGGTEALREAGEGEDTDTGAIGLSALLGSAAGFAQVRPGKARIRPMTPEEIDRIIAPAGAEAVTPRAEITPTADGYLVHMPGSSEGKTVMTRPEAEHAARELEANSSGYRSLGTVPRGTDNGSTRRSAFIHENPFTPEKMAQMVRRPEEDIETLQRRLMRLLTKAAPAAAIGAGLGYWLDRDDPGFGAGFGAAITLAPRALKRDKRITIEDVINTRNGLLNVFARHTLQFKSAIEALVPERERRAAISLAMEGHEGITLNANEQRVAGMVREFYDAMGRTAVDAGVIKELLHNYVTHIVEVDPEAAAAQRGAVDRIIDIITGRGGDRPTGHSGRQFTQHRRYASFGELMQALRGSNMRIKTGDIGEIMAVYASAMFKSITDKRMIDALKVTPVAGMPPQVIRKQVPESQFRRGSGKDLEPTIEGEVVSSRPVPPALPGRRALAPRRPGDAEPPAGDLAPRSEGIGFHVPEPPGPGETAQRFAARQAERTLVVPLDKKDSNYVDMPGRLLAGYAVHKDIAPQLNFVINARDPNDATLALMALNSASKRAIVSFSMFHARSLFDAFVGAMGVKGAANWKSMVDSAMAQFRYGGSNEAIDDMLMGGLQLTTPEDIKALPGQRAALQRIAHVVDQTLPVRPTARAGSRALKAFADFNDKLDHFTFGYLQTGFKLVTGLDAYERLVKKGVPRKQAGVMAASYANDLYGSLDWFRVANDVGSRLGRDVAYGFFNPNGRRMMQLLMFAPDWTFSTFRAAYKALPGAVDDPALAALHRRYLLKSALYYLAIANSINLVTAGHSIFSNENPTRVQLKDGRTMLFSKHFMEPFEWLHDPLQTAGNKLAFLPREAIEELTGKEYISVHDAAPDIANRAEHLASQFLPIPAQQGLAGGGVQSVLGLFGSPIYGKDTEQKRLARLQKKQRDELKRKKSAEYFRRLNQ